jgi:uracil-DNA glycosylase
MPDPFKFTSGPQSAKIVIVGEAFGEQEDLTGLPFVGHSGQELTRMLGEAGLDRRQCLLTNVFALRPPGNKIEALCGKKAEVGPLYRHPPLRQGKYFLPQYLSEVDRLRAEILAVTPNLVLALGNTACWALLGSAKISALRGTAIESSLCPGVKVIPTYHPAAVLRNWALRPIVVADLMKAKREAEFPGIVRPLRQVLVNPTLAEISHWLETVGRSAQILSCDIETGAGQIKCIGFAASRSDALVIPFVDLSKPDGSYWTDPWDELRAWAFVQTLLGLPCPKLFQNGLYDLQYLLRMGLRPRNCLHDTMLLHHSLYPEMNKGLGFLGSLYTNEAAWKLMRKEEGLKRDE